ncbi:MAG: hypothetical protein ACR2OO_07345 [Thermomicrobiales bacterium]
MGLILLSVMLTLLPTGWTLASSAVDDPSPAGLHQAVIAQGVAALPASPMAWRVVADTAEKIGGAKFEQRALGFAVATTNPILLTGQADGGRQRLAVGEAAFNQDAVMQMRETLSGVDGSYTRIALVSAAKAGDAGGDTLVFASDPFSAPAGARDVGLVRGSLQGGEKQTVGKSDFPVLVLAATGTIQVRIGAGAPTALQAGQAGAFTGGAVTVGGTGDYADWVAAVIGPKIADAAASTGSGPAPTVNPSNNGALAKINSGSITATGYLCPPSVTYGGDLSPCAATSDFDVTFRYDLQQGSQYETSFGADGSFDGTAYHLVKFPVQAIGSDTKGEDYLIEPEKIRKPAGTTGVVVQGVGVQPVQGAFQFELSHAAPDIALSIYFFTNPVGGGATVPSGDGIDRSGTIVVKGFLCPPGVTAASADFSGCVPTTDFDVAFRNGSQAGAVTTVSARNDGTLTGDAYVISNVPVAPSETATQSYLYGLDAVTPPGAATGYLVSGAIQGDLGRYQYVLATTSDPSPEIDVYFFQ